MELTISSELALPTEAVTETLAILAKRGAGKSYTAAVLVEEMLTAQLQVVVLDPMGHWYGLRSSVDGKSKGFPIAILGGDHGDVPLEPTAGAVVAELLVDERLSAILDVSPWSKADRRRFVADLLERLYQRNREAMHIVLEEADLFAPEGQLRDPGDQRMLGAVYDIVRRGRGRGIGTTLITQRSASLSKEVLDQTEILIALRTTGPRDRKAIEGWINVHADAVEAKAVMDSLPSLATGTAWVWWPLANILRQIHVRARRTFDSSATPKPGEHRAAPKTVADVDLAALQERMSATIERAKADDPRALKARIRELELTPRAEPKVEVRVEEVGVINTLIAAELRMDLSHIEQWAEKFLSAAHDLRASLDAAQAKLPAAGAGAATYQRPAVVTPPKPVTPKPVTPTNGELSLGKAEKAFLAALVQYPEGMDRARLAILTGYKSTSGHISNTLSSLRTKGLIELGDPLRISDAGRPYVADVPALPRPGRELVEYWLGRLGKAEATFLGVVVEAYPQAVSGAEIAERTGYKASSGHISNTLSALRTRGLIEGPSGAVRASNGLMG